MRIYLYFLIPMLSVATSSLAQQKCPKCIKNLLLVEYRNYSKDTVEIRLSFKPKKKSRRLFEESNLLIEGYVTISSTYHRPFIEGKSVPGGADGRNFCGAQRWKVEIFKNGKLASKRTYTPVEFFCIRKGQINAK